MSALITMTTDQGLAFGLALLAAGMIIQAGLTRWAEKDDEPIVADFDTADAESISITIDLEPVEPTIAIPTQRGESR